MDGDATFRIGLKDSPQLLCVSQGVEALLGFTPDDFLSGRVTLRERIHKEDADVADILFSPVGEESVRTVNLRIRGADGKIRCVKGQYTKTPNCTGKGIVLTLVLRDAREIREPGDQFLVDSYNALLADTPDYIYVKNRNHVLLTASKAVAELTGKVYDSAALFGTTDYDLHPEQEADRYYRLEKQLFTERQCVNEVQQVVAREGTKHWVDNRKYPIHGPTGEIVGLFGIAPDITRPLEAEQRLRESEESLREAQEIAGLGSFVLNIPSKQWSVSAELDALLGTGPDYNRAFEGLWPLIHPDDRAAIAERLQGYFSGERTQFDSEYRIIRQSDGAVRWVHTKGRLEFDAEGRPITLQGTVQDITERKEAVTALRESRELLELFIRHSPVGLAMFDREMRYLATSDRWLADHGLDGRGLIGRSHYEVFPNLPEDWKALHRRALMGEAVPEDECSLPNSDGSLQWLRRKLRPWFTGDGTIGGIILFAEDITESRRAQSALRESKEFLEIFVRRAPVALAMFDREMRYLAVSRRWREEYSLLDQEVLGHSHYEVVPEIPESWKEAHRRGLAGETLRADEDRFEQADGSVKWIRWEVVPWRTGDDSVGGIVLFAEDITAQKQSEERLTLAANVFTHAREGIVITDANGAILDVNETFTQITGYTREEVLGQNPRLLRSGLQNPAFYRKMWCSLREEGQWSGEIWNRRKSGDVYPEMLTISAVRDGAGRVSHYVALFADITELKNKQRQLEKIAHYDALTGLPNRVLLADRLRQAMLQAQRRNQSLAVAYLDLDGFKEINDTHGHVVGDQVLSRVASRMKFVLREGDTVARLGGDEFVALLLDLSAPDNALPVLRRLLRSAARSVRVGARSLRVSASIGVVYYPEVKEVDADQLLRQADQAMYQAKLAGGNRYHVFSVIEDSSVRSRYESLERVREAMANCRLVLYYQPKVNMRTGKVIGAEALLRLQHPERGLLSPAMFLPTTENDPLSIEIGEWGIENALAQMEFWKVSGLELPVSVNISGFHLQRPDFADRLRTLLAVHPLVDPSNLELEVLESSALLDIMQASQALEACRELGVSIALDDFGTGYSSLTYLKQLPANVLKIDLSFVNGMLENTEDLSIVEGVLSLAKAFRREVIAEGVESIEHGVMLLKLGCELGQGYAISPPVAASELPAWVATWRPDPRWARVRPLHNGNRSLLHAGVEHVEMLAGLESYLSGKRHAPPAVDMMKCQLSEWLGSRFHSGNGAGPPVRALAAIHQQFHATMKDVLETYKRGSAPGYPESVTKLHELRDQLLKKLETVSTMRNGDFRKASRSKMTGKYFETILPKDGKKSHPLIAKKNDRQRAGVGRSSEIFAD